MCPTVYLKTSKIDSCTPKVVFIIFMVRALVSCKIRTTLLIPIITIHICSNQTSIYTNSKKI